MVGGKGGRGVHEVCGIFRGHIALHFVEDLEDGEREKCAFLI